ncbi:MAG: hypothetical protein ABSF36_08710 [Candidatus Methanomethylicaceae archaeon]|jgi:hypothetical protein
MVDITTISIVIASIGVLAAVVYYFLDIWHRSRLRQTESLIRLSPWFNMSAKEVQEAISQVCSMEYENYEDYLQEYSGKPEQVTFKVLGNYFEGIGILVHRKLVDTDIVYDFWGDIIISAWEGNKLLVDGMRKDSGDAKTFAFWEYLYGELKKRQQQALGS